MSIKYVVVPVLVLSILLMSMGVAGAISVDDFSLADLGFRGFVVEANLDVQGTAQVLYGKTGALGSSTSLASSSSEHLLQVDGLESNTVYFYRVVGKDSSGNSYSSAISLTRTPETVVTPQPSNPDAKLLFASGFEGVRMGILNQHQKNYQTIEGTDSVTGFTWGKTSPQIHNSQLSAFHKITYSQTSWINEFVTMTGRTGEPTTALRQKIINDQGVAQIPFQINSISFDSNTYKYDPNNQMQDIYVRQWRKIRSQDLDVAYDWSVMWEYKTYHWDENLGEGYRVTSIVARDANGKLHTTLKGDIGVGAVSDPNNYGFSIKNYEVVPPLDEWFLYEYYVSFGDGVNTGRIWAKINGELVGEHVGRMTVYNSKFKMLDPVAFLFVWTLYGGNDDQQGEPGQEQWVDDIEIWDGIPGTLQESITPSTPQYDYNARDFGAKGDGITDDTAALQKAINAATTNKGTLFIPAGTYRVRNEAIKISGNDWKIIGEGEKTIITIPGQDKITWGSILEIRDADNWELKDITIDGNWKNVPGDHQQGIANLILRRANNWVIDGLIGQNNWYGNIQIGNVAYGTIKNGKSYNTDCSVIAYADTNNIVVEDNYINGHHWSEPITFYRGNHKNIVIQRNTMKNKGYAHAILIGRSQDPNKLHENILIQDNIIEKANGGIGLLGGINKDITIKNNKIYVENDAINVKYGENIIIENNIIDESWGGVPGSAWGATWTGADDAPNTGHNGILVENSKDITIRNNNMKNYGWQCIATPGSTNIVNQNNQCLGITI